MITEDHSYIPTTAEEWLELASDIAIDYDGCQTVEGLKDLIDEMREYVNNARKIMASEEKNNGKSI